MQTINGLRSEMKKSKSAKKQRKNTHTKCELLYLEIFSRIGNKVRKQSKKRSNK